MPIPASPQVIDYMALLPDPPTWMPTGRRKGPTRPWRDLWKATQSTWSYIKGVLEDEYPFTRPSTHRKNR